MGSEMCIRDRLRSQVAKAADCKSAIVGSTPTGASHQKTLAKSRKSRVSRGSSAFQPGSSPTTLSRVHGIVWFGMRLLKAQGMPGS